MNTEPKVSIITVCLNSEKTIRDTIESVIRQTYRNIEYIIVDGGSTDSTLSIINEYREYITEIISEKDKGIYDAFNKGINLSTGEIIGIINSDDWYVDDAVEVSVNAMIENSAEFCCANITIVDTDNNMHISCSNIYAEQWFGNKIMHPTVFASKELYNCIGLFDNSYKIASDYKWILEVFLNNRRVTYIDKAIVYFRKGGISTDPDCRVRTLTEGYQVVSDLISKYELHSKEYYDVLAFWREAIFKAKVDEVLMKRPEILKTFLRDERGTDTVVIWGTGHYGRMIIDTCLKTQIEVQYLIDSNPIKQNKTIYDMRIRKPDEIENDYSTVFFAIDLKDERIHELISKHRVDRNRIITLNDIRKYIGRKLAL